MPEDLNRNRIYLPAGQATNVVKDSNGRCWEMTGFVEQSELTPIEDLDTYDIIAKEICCEECNEDDLFEDLLIPYPSSSEDSVSSSSQSSNSSSPSSSSESDYYYGPEDIPCPSGCCETSTVGWGFTALECVASFPLDFEDICSQDCGPPYGVGQWGLCDPNFWATFGAEIPGVWSCGYCCQDQSSSSSESSSSESSSSESSPSSSESSSSSSESTASSSTQSSSSESSSSESSSSTQASSSTQSSSSESSSSESSSSTQASSSTQSSSSESSSSSSGDAPEYYFNNATLDAYQNNFVAAWKMNDSAGLIKDYINGHDGTYNGALYSQAGKDGTAIGFDGDDYVEVDDHADFDFTTLLSGFAWVKLSDNIGVDTIVAKYTTGGNLREWTLFVDAEKVAVSFGDPNNGTFEGRWTTDNNVVSDTNWHLIGFTYASGTVVVYVDGNAKAGSATSGAIPASLFNGASQVNIGSVNDGAANILTGTIDETWLWNAALSPAAVTALWNAGAGRFLEEKPWRCSSSSSSGV